MTEVTATVRIESNRLPAFRQQFPSRVAEALNAGAAVYARAVDPATPYETGELRGSRRTSQASAGRLEALVGWTADHAPHVHDGTVRQGAQPFARNTLRSSSAAIQAAAAGVIRGMR